MSSRVSWTSVSRRVHAHVHTSIFKKICGYVHATVLKSRVHFRARIFYEVRRSESRRSIEKFLIVKGDGPEVPKLDVRIKVDDPPWINIQDAKKFFWIRPKYYANCQISICFLKCVGQFNPLDGDGSAEGTARIGAFIRSKTFVSY